jgi:hypothetical protein
MRQTRRFSLISWVLVPAFALLAAQASAETYASYECASEKMDLAARRCGSVFRAWSRWAKTQKDPQGPIDRADEWFDAAWASAEDDAALENVDCVDITLPGADMKALMDTAIGDIVVEVTEGLDLGVKKQARCGSKILSTAATMCKRLLAAESKYIGDLSRDPDGTRLGAEQAKAIRQFDRRWDDATRRDCPTTADAEQIGGEIIALGDEVVTNTIVSPNVPDGAFMAITHPAGGEPGNPVSYEGDTLVPQCQDSSAFTFFAKRGTVNKLLMYYYGGGACWDTLTCALQTCTQSVNPNPPGLGGSGFSDFNHPDNPFKDWNIVLVPYCGCDIHIGDKAVDYLHATDPDVVVKHVEHRGYDNAKLAEKWAREHFLNPTDMFVTGSSAGSYGAMVHGAHLSEAYPASSINVMGDGGNGVATQEFMDVNFNNWGAMENLPDVPGIIGVPSFEMSIPLILKAAASYYPETNWSNYTTAFDGGGGGQTGFYNVMLNPGNPIGAQFSWWEASCQFNEVMRQQAFETADAVADENDNYRYYIATGSRHTGFGNPRVYDDTTGGVPPLVDWVNAMMDDDPSWTNVEADPFNVLFPGDPRPNPLQSPFEMVGSDVVVICE